MSISALTEKAHPSAATKYTVPDSTLVHFRLIWVGQVARHGCPEHRAQQEDRDDRLLLEGVGVQVLLDVEQGAGDDAGVVAEQEPADGRDD